MLGRFLLAGIVGVLGVDFPSGREASVAVSRCTGWCLVGLERVESMLAARGSEAPVAPVAQGRGVLGTRAMGTDLILLGSVTLLDDPTSRAAELFWTETAPAPEFEACVATIEEPAETDGATFEAIVDAMVRGFAEDLTDAVGERAPGSPEIVDGPTIADLERWETEAQAILGGWDSERMTCELVTVWPPEAARGGRIAAAVRATERAFQAWREVLSAGEARGPVVGSAD